MVDKSGIILLKVVSILSIPEAKKYTYEEFLEETKDVERVEFIDGKIYYMTAPSPDHQRILGKLFRKLGDYFDKTECEVFPAPLDVILKNEEETNSKSVQPDIVVICDKEKLTKVNYQGIPSMIVEIVSPSNEGHDFVMKMNLYMKYGVPEYWIVIPDKKIIQVYKLQNGLYEQVFIYSVEDILKSSLFKDLAIELRVIFND
jgi:Uma2 family endonuclease